MKTKLKICILLPILASLGNVSLFNNVVLAQGVQSVIEETDENEVEDISKYDADTENLYGTLLYEDVDLYAPSGHYISPEFTLNKMDKIKVYYKNNEETIYSTMRIEKKTQTGWETISTENVPVQQERIEGISPRYKSNDLDYIESENEKSQKFMGDGSTRFIYYYNYNNIDLGNTKTNEILNNEEITYRVRIDNIDGSPVEGELKVYYESA